MQGVSGQRTNPSERCGHEDQGPQFNYYTSGDRTLPHPMAATLDATAVCFDGYNNGMVAGYFDRAMGSIVLDEVSGEKFITDLEAGDCVYSRNICLYHNEEYYQMQLSYNDRPLDGIALSKDGLPPGKVLRK